MLGDSPPATSLGTADNLLTLANDVSRISPAKTEEGRILVWQGMSPHFPGYPMPAENFDQLLMDLLIELARGLSEGVPRRHCTGIGQFVVVQDRPTP